MTQLHQKLLALHAAMLLLTMTCGVAAAQDARQATLDLLEQGWQNDFKLIPQLESQYAAARAQAPQDADLVFAMALVHMKYSKYADAFADSKEYLKLRPDDPAGLRMHAWLAFTMSESGAALVDAEELSEHLPAAADQQPPNAELNIRQGQNGKPVDGEVIQETVATALTRDAYVRFLGAQFGFLGGPQQAAIPQAQVTATRESVIKRLADSEQEIFTSAESAVDMQFTLLSLERDQMIDDAKLQAEQFNAQETQRLLQERQGVAEDREGLKLKEAEYVKTRDAAMAQLEQQKAEIQSSARELSATADAIQREIVGMEGDIRRLFNLAENTQDPRLARRYRIDADNLSGLQDSRRFDLRNVRGQLDAASAALAQVNAQARDINSQFQAANKQLKRDAGKLNARDFRISRDLEKLSKPATGLNARVNNMTRRTESISTYVTLPLDAMQRNLVSKLKAQ